MPPAPDQKNPVHAPGPRTHKDDRALQQTVDLQALAMVGKGEQVVVGPIPDQTLDAFDQTLQIMRQEGMAVEQAPGAEEYAAYRPKDKELRKVFVFAEILGGYDAFNDITRPDSPRQRLSEQYGRTVLQRELRREELERLEEFHTELKSAIENARAFYRETRLNGMTQAEMHELYGLVIKARAMAKEITEVMGRNLILQIEAAVERLNAIRQKALSVERTVSGVFLVDDEVMYIPGNELVDAINTIFKGVGNPYLAGHVDGVLLLAARNLLIEVVSFYSYYGKHQIYQLFKQGHTVDRRRITMRIRNEIRRILYACKVDNKLVLTRIMDKEAQQLDLSIEAITREAEREAVEAVIRILPQGEPPPPPPRKKRWWKRFLGWVGA